MRKLLDFIMPKKSNSAALAKERLQIIVSHERAKSKGADFLPKLQRELVEVIAKYVHIDPEQVKVDLGETDNMSVLELNITLPNLSQEKAKEEATA